MNTKQEFDSLICDFLWDALDYDYVSIDSVMAQYSNVKVIVKCDNIKWHLIASKADFMKGAMELELTQQDWQKEDNMLTGVSEWSVDFITLVSNFGDDIAMHLLFKDKLTLTEYIIE